MKTSEIFNTLKQKLTSEEYENHKSSIDSLRILPSGISEEELYLDSSELRHFRLNIVKRNKDLYAIQDSFGYVYSKEKTDKRNQFTYESLPSGRTDDFLKNTRFSLEEAILIAEQEVEKLTLMGKTATQVKEMERGNHV